MSQRTEYGKTDNQRKVGTKKITGNCHCCWYNPGSKWLSGVVEIPFYAINSVKAIVLLEHVFLPWESKNEGETPWKGKYSSQGIKV